MASTSKQHEFVTYPGTTLKVAITIGGSGAVTAISKSAGIVSVAKNTTGTYDVTLERKYASVRYLDGSVQRASGATLHPRLAASYTPSLTLQFLTVVAAGTATDPSSGDVIYLNISFDDPGA